MVVRLHPLLLLVVIYPACWIRPISSAVVLVLLLRLLLFRFTLLSGIGLLITAHSVTLSLVSVLLLLPAAF